MSLIRWTPFVPSMFDEMDSLLNDFVPSSTRAFMPALDVYQTADEVIVETALPGIDASDVTVSIENDVLTIEGKTEKKTEVDDKNYYRKEIRAGSFHRVVALPSAVDGDQAKAEYRDGILKIIIPKREEIKPKKVSIEVK